MSADLWAGMVDPQAALRAAREATANSRKLSQAHPKGCESGSPTKSKVYEDFRDSRNFRGPPLGLSQFREEKPKQKSDLSSSSYIAETGTYLSPALPAGLPDPDLDLMGERASAKVAKVREYGLTHSDRSGTALAGGRESFAVTNTVPSPVAHLSGPAAWRDGLARLDRWAPPCPGFRMGEWDALHRIIAHFMDHAAAEASRLGWTALDLFGVHRDAGAAAVDSCGALMLPFRKPVSTVSADAIAFGPLVYRRRPMPQTVLAWEFAGGDWREEA